MSDIQLFDFHGAEVRTVQHDDGSAWFVGVDVCDALGHSNATMALSRLDDDEKSGVNIPDPHGREQVTTVISESGLYSLVLSSRKPEARAFKKWVTSEVLPALRQTGRYEAVLQSPLQHGNAHIKDHLDAAALFNVPRHVALTTGAQEAQRLYGVDYTPYLLASPDMRAIDDQEVFLEPSGLAAHLGIAVRQVNPYLVKMGLQTRTLAGWLPTEEALSLGICQRHQWVKDRKSGYNFLWNLAAVMETHHD